MEVTESLEDVVKGVGNILYDLRVSHKLTQRQMAKALQVGQARISDLELGRGDPKVSTLLKYAQFFDQELWIFITPPESTTDETAQLSSD